ncbi:MAG TPA: disulfide bond formation protein B [Acidimicrobiia bacterium]|nr:disulfide bond formation protein B [Acidimicrobiia bacterium]
MSAQDWFDFFAALTVATNAATLALVVLLVLARVHAGARERLDQLRDALGSSGLALATLVAGTAMAGSLYLSEGAHLIPCELCWYQRIGMYSLAIVLLVAAVRRDWGVRPYAVTLASLGLLVSSYHYLIERFPDLESSATCDPLNPCTVTLIWKLHYISIPFMAGSAFLLSALVLVLARPTDRGADPSTAGASRDDDPVDAPTP